MTAAGLPGTLLADLKDLQPPILAAILIGGCLAKLSRVLRVAGGTGVVPAGRHWMRAWAPPTCSRSRSAARFP